MIDIKKSNNSVSPEKGCDASGLTILSILLEYFLNPVVVFSFGLLLGVMVGAFAVAGAMDSVNWSEVCHVY